MKYVMVTSFSQDGYEAYGRRMIQSYLDNPLQDCELWVYSDEALVRDIETPDTVKFYSLAEEVPEQGDFEARHNSPICHGKFGTFYDYRFDAVRFSHKPASLFAAVTRIVNMNDKPEVLLWFDGDTVFKKPLDDAFLSSKLPSWAHVGHFPRENNHTEAGILMFRVSNTNVVSFLRIMWQVYKDDQVFRVPAWTDCHVLDALIAGTTKDGILRTVNLGDELSLKTQHPIVNSDWFAYVDHLKGDRKTAGQSHESDFVTENPAHVD